MGRNLGLLLSMLVACGTDDGSDTAAAATSSGMDTSTGASTSSTADTGGSSTTAAGSSSDTGSQGGCGVDPGIRGAVAGQIEAAGLQRRFLLVVPDGYDPAAAYPLVFGLHGRGSNGEQFRMYAGVEEASAGQAIFVYPDGLPVESMAGQTGWELGADDRDVALFDALYDELTTNLCVDVDRVYATGHSYGGFFSNILGCVRGDRLRAIAPVAGGKPAASCTGQVAVWIAHGEDDQTVDTFLGQMALNAWVSRNNCDAETEPVEPDPCVAYLGCDEGYDVHWCLHSEQTQGIGTHGWPSFAGDAIWAFFDAH